VASFIQQCSLAIFTYQLLCQRKVFEGDWYLKPGVAVMQCVQCGAVVQRKVLASVATHSALLAKLWLVKTASSRKSIIAVEHFN
jgi:hypothetical protein